MAEARLRAWATEFQVKFEYTSDFGVDAKFAAGLEGCGLKAGGSFQSHQRIEQLYRVAFHPRSAYE